MGSSARCVWWLKASSLSVSSGPRLLHISPLNPTQRLQYHYSTVLSVTVIQLFTHTLLVLASTTQFLPSICQFVNDLLKILSKFIRDSNCSPLLTLAIPIT